MTPNYHFDSPLRLTTISKSRVEERISRAELKSVSMLNSLPHAILCHLNPKVAFYISEKLPHLGLRMKEHCHITYTYASRMKNLGLKFIYPDLEYYPYYALLNSILRYGYGGILCVDMDTEERANNLM